MHSLWKKILGRNRLCGNVIITLSVIVIMWFWHEFRTVT